MFTSDYILLLLTTSVDIWLHPSTSDYNCLCLPTSFYVWLHLSTSDYICVCLLTSIYIWDIRLSPTQYGTRTQDLEIRMQLRLPILLSRCWLHFLLRSCNAFSTIQLIYNWSNNNWIELMFWYKDKRIPAVNIQIVLVIIQQLRRRTYRCVPLAILISRYL